MARGPRLLGVWECPVGLPKGDWVSGSRHIAQAGVKVTGSGTISAIHLPQRPVRKENCPREPFGTFKEWCRQLIPFCFCYDLVHTAATFFAHTQATHE